MDEYIPVMVTVSWVMGDFQTTGAIDNNNEAE